MTEQQRQFRKNLETLNARASTLMDVDGNELPMPTPTFMELVLQHGRFYEPQPRRKGMRKGAAKECFYNAWQFTMKHSEYRYVEGFIAAGALPVHHGFVVDAAGAYELTLPAPVDLYFGVEFKCGEILDADGTCALGASNDWYSRSRHPAAVKRFHAARI